MSWFRRGPGQKAAERLYAALVAQARRPEFYSGLGVPDSLDGRFEMLALHAFLVLRRLKREPSAASLAQALANRFVEDMDASLREMGGSDLGVGRRVRTMAQALYGRIAAYDAALEGEGEILSQALGRNVYGTRPDGPEAGSLAALTAYVRAEAARLAAVSTEELAQGCTRFGSPPFPAGGGQRQEHGGR